MRKQPDGARILAMDGCNYAADLRLSPKEAFVQRETDGMRAATMSPEWLFANDDDNLANALLPRGT